MNIYFYYCRVRLAINRSTQEAVAVKIVNADKLVGNKDNLKKEVFKCFITSKMNFLSKIIIDNVSNWEALF